MFGEFLCFLKNVRQHISINYLVSCLSYSLLLGLVEKQSNLYAIRKNITNEQITKDEFKVFCSILLVSGYSNSALKAALWDNGDDIRTYAVHKAMRRNKFDHIMQCLHFADNNELDIADKYSKIRSLVKLLQRKFMKHFIPCQNISQGEPIIE